MLSSLVVMLWICLVVLCLVFCQVFELSWCNGVRVLLVLVQWVIRCRLVIGMQSLVFLVYCSMRNFVCWLFISRVIRFRQWLMLWLMCIIGVFLCSLVRFLIIVLLLLWVFFWCWCCMMCWLNSGFLVIRVRVGWFSSRFLFSGVMLIVRCVWLVRKVGQLLIFLGCSFSWVSSFSRIFWCLVDLVQNSMWLGNFSMNWCSVVSGLVVLVLIVRFGSGRVGKCLCLMFGLMFFWLVIICGQFFSWVKQFFIGRNIFVGGSNGCFGLIWWFLQWLCMLFQNCFVVCLMLGRENIWVFCGRQLKRVVVFLKNSGRQYLIFEGVKLLVRFWQIGQCWQLMLKCLWKWLWKLVIVFLFRGNLCVGSRWIDLILLMECWVFGLKVCRVLILLLNRLIWKGNLLFIGNRLISVLWMVNLLCLQIVLMQWQLVFFRCRCICLMLSFWLMLRIRLLLSRKWVGVRWCKVVEIGIISMLCLSCGNWQRVVMCWEMMFWCGEKMLQGRVF